MDLEKIEGLVKIIENSSLTEFSIKDGETKITMSKLTHPPVIAAGVPAAPMAPAPQTAAAEEKAEAADRRHLLLRVGTGCTGLCQGRRSCEGRTDGMYSRGDEAHE